MKHILYLSAVSDVGGAEESLLLLLAHLDRTIITPHLVVPQVADSSHASPLATRAAEIGVSVHALPLPRVRRTLNPLALWRLRCDMQAARKAFTAHLQQQIPPADIIHANTLTAALFADSSRPLICHVRDLRMPRVVARSIQRRSRLMRIVAPSQRLAGIAREHFGEIVRRVSNPVDLAIFHPAALPAEESPAQPTLLMVAHLVPWKRHDVFLDCLAEVRKKIPAVRGVIIGRDVFAEHSSYREQLREQATRLGVADCLRWDEHAAPSDVARQMREATVLVHPARGEPFGRVIAEAMASGLAVVAVNDAGPAEILAAGGGGLVDASANASAFAAAALPYLISPTLAQAHGDTGRKLALTRYTPQAHARAIERLYA